MHWIIAISWMIMSSLTMVEIAPHCEELGLFEKAVVFMIVLIGGPIFAVNTILTMLLNCILPDSWDNDDDGVPKI